MTTTAAASAGLVAPFAARDLAAGLHALADAALDGLFDAEVYSRVPLHVATHVASPEVVRAIAARFGTAVETLGAEGRARTCTQIPFGPLVQQSAWCERTPVELTVVHVAAAVTR